VKLIKQYAKKVALYKVLKAWLAHNDAPKTLFLYTASGVFLDAVQRLKKEYDFTVCVIIADLPNMSALSSKRSALAKKVGQRRAARSYELLSCADRFVLLTKHMAEYMQLDKPYCVMEGISTAREEFAQPNYQSEVKTVFYGGTLHRKFGVLNLLEAFRQIPSPDYRLILCGVGDGEEEIKAAASQDSRIDFRGRLPREEVLKLQSQATVLVNPRQNNEEFTKYSFPSKNLEYLSSGIPFIAYKLDGIPDEYDEYILYVADNETRTLAEKIMEVCEKTPDQREQLGKKAREFVSTQKNAFTQTGKILAFMQET
jgi:glycosyltransferase involved in cell wall biosynthesis